MSIYGKPQISQEVIDTLTRVPITTRALDTGLNILSTVGKILDTPGSIIRGALSETPEKALTGIFDASERVTGKQLLGTSSLLGGLGAEIALDPLTYLSFGTLSGAGKLASRAGKLADAEQILRVSKLPNAGRRLSDVYSGISKVVPEQLALGREPLERLAGSLAGQAASGQRSLIAFDLPFTGINVPLVQGATAFKGIDKAGQVIKSLPLVDKLLNKFSTTHNFDELTKGIKTENSIGDREAEITASLLQKDLGKSIDDIAKASGKPRNEVEQELIKLIEQPLDTNIEQLGLENLSKFYRQQERLSSLPSPQLVPLANKIKSTFDDLLKTEQEFGLPLSKLDNSLGYSPRYLTPEARLYIKDSDTTLRKLGKILKVNIPGFAQQRRLFGDKELAQANELIRKKLKVDFDFFSSDIATNTAYRVLQSKKAINEANTRLLAFKLLGKNKDALTKGDRVDLGRLLRSSKGKPLLNKLTVDELKPIWSKYNLRTLVDDDGNVILKATEGGTEDAVKWLKILREIRNDERLATDITSIGSGASIDILEPLAKKYGVEVRELDELVERLNLTNTIYHGTSSLALEKIIGSGKLKAIKPTDNWLSSKIVKSKPSVFFTPKRSLARNYAGNAASRAPGGTEYAPGSLTKYAKDSFDYSKYDLTASEIQTFKNISFNADMYNDMPALVRASNLPDVLKVKFAKAAKDLDTHIKSISNHPELLEAKLSDLFLFDKLHPEVREAILEQNFKTKSKLIPLGKYDVSHITGGSDDLNNLPQIMTKEVEAGLFKPAKESADFNKLLDKSLKNSTVANAFNKQYTLEGVLHSLLKYEGLDEGLEQFNKYVDASVDASDEVLQKIKNAANQYVRKSRSINLPIVKREGKEFLGFKETVINLEPNKAKGYIRKTLDEAGLKDRFVSKGDYENVQKILGLVNDYKFVGDYTKMLDNVNSIYKTFLTQLFPAYHARNFMGNVFVNTLAGVYNPKYYADAFKQLAFKQLPPDEIIYLKSIGVLGQGQHEEIYRLINESDVGKAKIFQSKILQPARELGFFTDDVSRLAHYYSKKAAGLTDKEAAESVVKYLFDYNDLTGFEKNVMRRTMLFYTFMRKNIPLMLKQFGENPRFIQAYNRAVGNTQESELPSWFNETILTGDSQWQLGLPIEDLSRFDTEGQGMGKLARMLASLLTPAITVPVEFTTGTSLYTGQQQTGGRIERLLQSSPLARFATTYNRITDTKDVPSEILKLLTGIKRTEYTDEDLTRLGNIEKLKNTLEEQARQGKANRVTIYGKNEQSDEQLKQLNQALTKQYK